MDIVAEFSLCDGPGALMVSLEGSYLTAEECSFTVAIVVYSPVVDTSAEV